MSYCINRTFFLTFQTKHTTFRIYDYRHVVKPFYYSVVAYFNAFFASNAFVIVYFYLYNQFYQS
jgi:hypothetical protein